MSSPLLDPQLEAFYASDPSLLRPESPPGPSKPWFEEPDVELAAAVLITVGLVRHHLAQQPPPEDPQAVAGQAWRHHAPIWLRFAAPAIHQAYTAGSVQGLTEAEQQALAQDYAEGLGDYVNESSSEALLSGYDAQLAGGWNERVAWQRVTAAYGVDKPGMRTFLHVAIQKPQDGQPRDLVGHAARLLADRLLLERAEVIGANETWTATQAGQSLAWVAQQRRGQLPADARRRWVSHESACEICEPMNGQEVALGQTFVTPGGNRLLAPAAHPGCKCVQELVIPDGEVSKATASDPYDRNPKGEFARRETRTRNVTHLAYADPHETPPEVQAILDEVAAIKNPFGVDHAPAKANPFGRTVNPFKAGANPFGVVSNPFAAVANPFKAAQKGSQGANPFDQTKRQSAKTAKWGQTVEVHHFFFPKKKVGEEAEYEYDDSAFYLPYRNYLDANEWDGNEYLLQPGDHFNFDPDRQGSGKWDDASHGTAQVDMGAFTGLVEGTTYGEGGGATGDALVAIQPDPSPWTDPEIIFDADERLDFTGDPEGAKQLWRQNILPLAIPLWQEAMDNPSAYVDKLTNRDVDHIYQAAGYESAEDDFERRSRIVYACGQHGLGDDSLSEAYADFMVWTMPSKMGENGEALARELQEAESADCPPMGLSYGEDPAQQVFVFDQGFHPLTEAGAQGGRATLDADYMVHHIIYRSALGELGYTAPPFIPALREAVVRPSDAEGNFLYGGPYRDPAP